MSERRMLMCVTALATARALSVIARDEPLAGALFLAGCLAVWAGRSPWFLAAGCTACSMLMTHQTGSVVLFAWVAAAFACLTGPQLVVALRSQVVVVYGFAVAHKLLSEDFMSGRVIHGQVPALPYPQLAAAGVVVIEAFLAYAVVKRWPIAVPVAVVAHTSFVAGMSQSLVHAVALGAFNLHICLLIWWVTASSSSPRTPARVPASTRCSGSPSKQTCATAA